MPPETSQSAHVWYPIARGQFKRICALVHKSLSCICLGKTVCRLPPGKTAFGAHGGRFLSPPHPRFFCVFLCRVPLNPYRTTVYIHPRRDGGTRNPGMMRRSAGRKSGSPGGSSPSPLADPKARISRIRFPSPERWGSPRDAHPGYRYSRRSKDTRVYPKMLTGLC